MLTLAAADTLAGVADVAAKVTCTIMGMELNAGTEVYKVLTQNQLAAAAATLYTVPGSTTSFVKSIQIVNTDTAATHTFQLYRGGTVVANSITPVVTLSAGGFATYEDGEGWQSYDAFGNIRSTSSVTTGLANGFINVKDYGAKGDGATDDKVAIQNAINAAGGAGVSGRGIDLFFPPGVYAISGTLTCPFNNIMFTGAGWQSTILYATFTTTDILQLGDGTAHSGCGVKSMSVWCNASRTTGNNININNMSDCVINNFVINNCFNGITVQGASIKVWIEQGEINNIGVTTGVGIQVTNGAAGDTYISNIVQSNNPANKPAAGIQITQTGHCSINRCNVTSATVGLSVNPGAGQDVNYVYIDHTLFDSCGTHGAKFFPTNATGRIRSVVSVNSWFSGTLVTAGYGIELGGTASSTMDGFNFIGCRILNNFEYGVGITYASATNISFTDCDIAGNGQHTINTYDGVTIVANVNGVSFMNCVIGQMGTATNQQRFAINIAAGTSANIQLLGNTCTPNGTVGTHGYINIGALTGGNIVIDGNTPQPMAGQGACTVAASAALTTTETVIGSPFKLAVNGMRAGSVIKARLVGSCTVATAAAVPGKFIVRLGTAGTTGDTAIMTFTLPTSGAVGTSVFDAEIILACRTVGAAATFAGSMRFNQASATLGLLADVAWALAGVAATGVTTTANFVTITFGNTGSANVTVTFQIVDIEVTIP